MKRIKFILNRFKHYVKQIMPYKYVLKYEDKHNFHKDFFAWEKSGKQVEFDNESKFDNIIAVQGFGYSGSGAVIDLLREYDDCLVHGLADEGSQAIVASDDLGEVTFPTEPGGLVDIDKHIESASSVNESEALNRFAKMIYKNDIYFRGEKCRDFIYLFFASLIEDRQIMHGSLSPIMKSINSVIYQLRNLSKTEYYQLCSRFIYSIFNLQYKDKYKFIVLDQFFQGASLNPEYVRNFVPNLKSVVVYRDPRDIYVIANELDVPWLEHDTVDHFIRRIKRMYAKLDVNATSYLPIKFEDIVMNYDTTVSKIEKYLKLGEHNRPNTSLNVSISAKNIGMWRHHSSIPQEEFSLIEKTFPEYCYNGRFWDDK